MVYDLRVLWLVESSRRIHQDFCPDFFCLHLTWPSSVCVKSKTSWQMSSPHGPPAWHCRSRLQCCNLGFKRKKHITSTLFCTLWLWQILFLLSNKAFLRVNLPSSQIQSGLHKMYHDCLTPQFIPVSATPMPFMAFLHSSPPQRSHNSL